MGTPDGIVFGEVQNGVVQDCIIDGYVDHGRYKPTGIGLYSSSYNIIENCTIRNIYNNGIQLSFDADPESGSNNNIIRNCNVSNCGTVSVQNTNGIMVRHSHNNIIYHNNFFGP